MKEFSDIEIIDCLRNRQSHVVRYLSERYLPMIRLMVIQNGGDSEDAQDIFQDGLIIMLEKIDDSNFVLTCKFKTYLYCVCENLWKTVLDKRRAAANYFARKEEDDHDQDLHDIMDQQIYKNIFNEVFQTLESSDQMILQLYWQDVPPQEIATRLGFTYGYVRKKKCEVQAALIEKVKKHPGYKQIMHSDRATREIVK